MYPRFRSANGSNDSFNENPNMPITPITPVGFVKILKNNNDSFSHAMSSLSFNLFLLYSPLYMEEDTKGIRKENFALSLNIRLVQ